MALGVFSNVKKQANYSRGKALPSQLWFPCEFGIENRIPG
jgi:hypothetical protein